jgi:hypothetical protein
MTPKEKLPVPAEVRQKEVRETDLFALPPDDEPYELPPWDPQAAIALLRQWREDESDTEEQCETWEYLKRVLDEDRLSPDRKLFP